jgi:hypothetical protein
VLVPGRLRIGSIDLPLAAYTWLMERSDSLLAPITEHGVSNAVEVAW